MSKICFGSSVGPSGVKSVGKPQFVEEESEKQDDADPNQLIQCPYDKNHQIRAGRFPFHILKCRRNNPKVAGELQTCPFNARHLIPRSEFSSHVRVCENRTPVFSEDETQHKFNIPLTPWKGPAPEEDWDKEADDQAVPFVWGVSTNQLIQPMPNPCTTNSLPPGLRAPRTLPWKPCEFPK